jgi:hypothetical protein
MSIPRSLCWSLCLVFGAGLSLAGCASETTTSETTGSLSLDLVIGDGTVINEVDWEITRGDMKSMSGTINTSAPGSTASVEVFGLPPSVGKDYTITMEATATDGETTCKGSEDFGIDIGEVTDIMVMLNCKRPQRLGAVRVNGEFNICAELAKVVVSPLQTSVGNDIDLSAVGVDAEGDSLTYVWNATGGSIDDSSAPQTTYTCEEVGKHAIMILVTDNDDYCKMATWTVPVTCVEGDGLECLDDEDCDKGEMCVDNECVPGLECVEDEDCELGEICLDNKCVPDLECTVNEDCDTGEICVDNVCVPDLECTMNEECEIDEICNDNVCVSDPDIFCDEGLCATEPALRAECVQTFLVCLADNIDEEECVLASLLICRECTTNEGCSAGETCVDNICVVSFAAQIQPYFEPGLADCVYCHSDGGPKGVDLDSYVNILAGGNNGPLVVPFDSADPTALLIPKLEANHNDGPDDAAFVPILARWIDQGAQDN